MENRSKISNVDSKIPNNCEISILWHYVCRSAIFFTNKDVTNRFSTNKPEKKNGVRVQVLEGEKKISSFFAKTLPDHNFTVALPMFQLQKLNFSLYDKKNM